VFVHGVQTYVIHYTQVDTIRYFADADDDEFYWDVNGTGWAQPFAEVSATVTVDPALVTAVRPGMSCYQGLSGGTDECSEGISTTDNRVFTAAGRDLEPGETLTVVIPFQPHTFVEGEPSQAPRRISDRRRPCGLCSCPSRGGCRSSSGSSAPSSSAARRRWRRARSSRSTRCRRASTS
jgi:hypothetical protein